VKSLKKIIKEEILKEYQNENKTFEKMVTAILNKDEADFKAVLKDSKNAQDYIEFDNYFDEMEFRKAKSDDYKWARKIVNKWLDVERANLIAQEKHSADWPFLKTLSDLFTGTVHLDDIKNIKFRPYKNYVSLKDIDGRLGHIDATTSNSSIENFLRQNRGSNKTVKDLIKFLEENGAQKI